MSEDKIYPVSDAGSQVGGSSSSINGRPFPNTTFTNLQSNALAPQSSCVVTFPPCVLVHRINCALIYARAFDRRLTRRNHLPFPPLEEDENYVFFIVVIQKASGIHDVCWQRLERYTLLLYASANPGDKEGKSECVFYVLHCPARGSLWQNRAPGSWATGSTAATCLGWQVQPPHKKAP